MIEDVSSRVEFYIKHKLSTNQFLLLELLHTEQYFKSNQGLKYKTIGNIYKWSKAGQDGLKGAGWTAEEVEDLIAKEYVFGIKSKQKDLNGKEIYGYSIDQLILTQKFSDIMFINSNFAFDEILEIYPDTFLITKDGHTNTVFSKAGDLDKVQQNYHKLIKGNILKHEEVKEIVLYAKSRNLCNYKLENFLTKGVIDSIKKMMGEHKEKDINDGQQEL